jgi:hypothetical protein
MKHTRLLFFSLAIFTTCYIAYYSVQRNTLAPSTPLSTLIVALTENESTQTGLAADIINDLAHRMTQHPSLKTYSVDRAIYETKKGTIHCAIIPHEVAKKETESCFVIPLLQDSSKYNAIIISRTQPNFFKRINSTILEMSEDGAFEDFVHKWNAS